MIDFDGVKGNGNSPAPDGTIRLTKGIPISFIPADGNIGIRCQDMA